MTVHSHNTLPAGPVPRLGTLSRWMGTMVVFLAIFAAALSSARAQANVGIGTTSPNASALLDLTSTTKGVLVPRMTHAQMNLIASPATGLIVYCTDYLSSSSPSTFYYYNGSAWVPFLSTAWQLTGNAGTIAGTNFVGTTDNADLVFKTNSTEGMRLTTASNVGIGTSTPSSILQTVASGAETSSYIGNLLTNLATSSTASIDKYGTQIQSTGAWTGTLDTNVGLLVNATGGTSNISAIFEGGDVGINTAAPATSLGINGDLATRYSSYTASNGANNDISIGTSSFVRITGPTAAFSITGISGGVDGKWLTLFNATTQQITIANENASSSAADRIWTLNSTGDIVISGKAAVRMIYDAADSRWLVISSSTTVSTSSTGVITVKKPTDQSVTSSTTLVNDNDLKISINANDSMIVEGYLHTYCSSHWPHIQIAWTIPAGASMDIGSYIDDVSLGSHETFTLTSSGTSTGTINTNSGTVPIHFWGVVITGSTAGTIQLKWAQAVSSSTPMTVKANSYMRGFYIR